MNEIAGYFKELKEENGEFENQVKLDNLDFYDTPNINEPGQSKPKKLFSFLKWFNKKQKHEPNMKIFTESSAASSPIFPRKQNSSCESIDTLFSTQTVRSFAYIPPTEYVPSAPPLEFDKSLDENRCESDSLKKNMTEEAEINVERRKKRKAPKPPRLSRENSLPTTLQDKKNEEIKAHHRRTVSESFKDKKAGACCHVQGKKKAPPPPGPFSYPNLQKVDNQYASLCKKKKPAPPPPESNFKIQNSNEFQKSKKNPQNGENLSQPSEKVEKKKSEDNRTSEKKDKELKINQTSNARLTRDASLSPIPSRPWYKRNHRDPVGSNIIRKDLLKGFDKKKSKETDDWMPEVGFSRRSFSTESSQSSKFNIFLKLEKTDDRKKEEKRKSQISILTNISELDREAAEIVRKEHSEERKLLAENDAKYYSTKVNNEKPQNISERSTNETKNDNKHISKKIKSMRDNPENRLTPNTKNGIIQAGIIFDQSDTGEVKDNKNPKEKDELSKIMKTKDKESHSNVGVQPKKEPKQNFSLSPKFHEGLSSQPFTEKAMESSPNISQARLNFFNVENKSLNYMNEPWVCKKCTLENPGWRVFCEICNSVKPRFSFQNSTQTKEMSKEKILNYDFQKLNAVTEKSEELKKLNLKAGNQAPWAEAIENMKPRELLNELKKKSVVFPPSRSEYLLEYSKTKFESLLSNNEVMLSSKGKEEDNTEELSENRISRGSIAEELKDGIKEVSETSPLQREKPNTKVLVQQNSNDDLNCSILKKNQLPSEKSQVVEAYVVTKTIVLEDVIVKKPERNRKVSTSAQKTSICPPSRTKKMTFDTDAVIKKETEAQAHLKNASQNEMKNYKQEELEELTNRLTQAEGLANFRANIENMPPNTELNTVAVNYLLRKLETAIISGDHFLAAGMAKELALMKINCSVTRQLTPSPSTSKITINLYIEDKVSHQGPIPMEVLPKISVLQLKHKVQRELGIPVEVQRWILSRKLATDDNKTLESEGVRSDYCPVFLYLVTPGDQKTDKVTNTKLKKLNDEFNQDSELDKESCPAAKTKGWYYNHKDHCNSCEDSEDEKKNLNLSSKTKEIKISAKNVIYDIDARNTEEKSENEKKSFFVDLKSRNVENCIEKELKLISPNSVKQKIEKLNKTFAESAKEINPPLRSSQSPETWKCEACHFVNLPGKLKCLSCKEVFSSPFNKNVEEGKNAAKKEALEKKNPLPAEVNNIHYKALIELQDTDLVPNSEPFNCSICLVDYEIGKGVTLKDCLHTFCRTCLMSTVQFSEDAEVKCPYVDETYSCPSVLQQREIKALVPQGIFELHLAKSVKEAENKIDNAFHCKTPDCKGWCIYEDNVNEFHCPVCKSTNCLTCQAIHTGINCREFQKKMKDDSETDINAKKTTDMLNEMVEKGEAMACPKCQVVLMKKWGCDWLKCSMCKTEICWVTRGFRWGPEGKGDISGGCKCGISGLKCHPKCNYCH